MRSLADDDEVEVKPSGPAKTMTAEQPAWMRALLERSKEWLNAVPEVSSLLSRSGLIQCFLSEIQHDCEASSGESGPSLSTVLP